MSQNAVGLARKALTRRDFLKVAGTGLGGLLILSSCGGGSGGGDGSASDTIVFGASLPLTGDLAKEGELAQDGYRFYKNWINSHGGIKVGDKTYQADLKIYDDSSDPNQAAQLYQRLITQDNVKHLLGPYGSSATLQVEVIAQKFKLPLINTNGGSMKIYEAGNKFIFGVLSPASKYLQSVIEVAAAQTDPAPETVAFITENDAFSLDATQAGIEYAKASGLRVVANKKVPAGNNDFTAVLSDLKSQNPDVLIGSGHFTSSVGIMKTARSTGFNAKMYGFTVGPSIPDFYDSLGETANYVVGTVQWTPDLKFEDPLFGTAQEFTQNFKEQFGYVPDYHVAESAVGPYAYQLAMQEAGTTEPQKARDALAKLEADTFFGHIEFDEAGKNVYKEMAAIQWQDGKKVTPWPEDAPGKLAYPAPPWGKR